LLGTPGGRLCLTGKAPGAHHQKKNDGGGRFCSDLTLR